MNNVALGPPGGEEHLKRVARARANNDLMNLALEKCERCGNKNRHNCKICKND